MSDIAILKEMIKENITVSLSEEKNGTHFNYLVELIEPQDNYSVIIDGMPKPDQVVVIKAEKFAAPKTVFQGGKGECKRADFIIIADTPTEKIIICIEMKKSKGNLKTVISQLNGAKCFISYCQEIGRIFWHQHNFLEGYQYRFVSIAYIPVSKTKTRLNQGKKDFKEVHDSPEKMLKIFSTNYIQFDSLIHHIPSI
ncbi:hypothetical protein H6F32_19045 [Anabaena sp. FACHB-1237]|uniref:hypothetical protein n=1 Tax=Anabaena sp. FACHB-1237 TaxID=2692769 RepID=UPI0016801225|nr:hypothetical protein [Anabaena sp. FACHB-1237]MBD2139603.1 hypothetical protein [Anabaena sp. FACHB-1237]